MTVRLKYPTDHKKFQEVLIDKNHLVIVLEKEKNLFRYNNTKNMYKVLVAQFTYRKTVVSQAFYESQTAEYRGTWLPFDGIKGDTDDNNTFYTYADDEAFHSNLAPFGIEELVYISYLIGGGIWERKDDELSMKYKFDERVSMLSNHTTLDVKFEDSLVINHYINYAISKNYMTSRKPKWTGEGTKNEQKLFSAFDFSNKMKNKFQIEYTPRRLKDHNTRGDYEQYYKKMNNAIVAIPVEKENKMCTIL